MSYRRRGYGPRYPQDTRGSIPHRNFPSRAAPPHTFAPRNNTLLRNGEDWRTWGEVSIRITGLAPFATITDIYENFTESGTISRIMFDMDRSGSRTGVAIVTFSPPPSHAFWNMEKIDIYYPSSSTKWPLELTLMDKKRTFEHPSPVNSKKFYPERIALECVSLDFGFMYAPETMKIMRTVESTPERKVLCVLDLLRRRLEIVFQLRLETIDNDLTETGSAVSGDDELEHTFVMRIPLSQLQSIVERDSTDTGVKDLIIPLQTPPQVFRKTQSIEKTQLQDPRFWNEQWTWFRQTDIPGHDLSLRKSPITVLKPSAMIDIGRWTTYRLRLDKSKISMPLYNNLCQALKDYNVSFPTPSNGFNIMTGHSSTLWDWIDVQDSVTVSNAWMLDMVKGKAYLPYRLRYQLEVCITHGFLNEHNITKDFVTRLKALGEQEAVDRLEFVAELRKRFFDPSEIFDLILPGTSSSRRIPAYCVYARSATITPSSIYYSSPSVETSNRIIRQWQEHSDRFLRVRFTDEKLEGKVRSPDNATYNAVFARINRCLKNGILIGDRHFEFLAWGNSQFREHGAYFFASTPGLTAATIRGWMGDLNHIKSISRHASRLGQCFSTTRAINGTKVKVVEIPDVKKGKYTFTDGVGKISRFLAQVIAVEMGLPNPSDDPPSLFQFRMGGCKGVLAVEPDPKIVGMREVHIRESQYKFAASHEGLEVIRYSSFATPTLNRQLITILSCLQIPDGIFLEKLELMLQNLEKAMVDEKMALSLLQKQIDPNQTTLTIAAMMLDGFMKAKDPFAISLLHLWRAWTIKALKEKAGIVIEQGAFVLGCTDETKSLRGHYDNVSSLPEIFIQVSQPALKGTPQYQVIEGICIVARNPSLHPGDIRVVRAVNVPALRHLKNVVVFAQTGDRDVPSMCSGGDLDGDDFFVSWDQSLIPPKWNYPPMDFESKEPAPTRHQLVTVDDITSFFVTYMQHDKLGAIATASLACSDWYDLGARSEQCIELAQLHSIAVDYPKSGIRADMPRRLRPPKFPHFMESKYRPKDQIYHSSKILGQLYDKVDRIDFHPLFSLEFDNRILNAYQLSDKILQDASTLKAEYDSQMRRIMAQHEIQTEFEVWTTFVLSHAQLSKDYSFHEEMGRIKAQITERFQKLCYEKAAANRSATTRQDTSEMKGRNFEDLGPFVAAMYTVTARDIKEAIHSKKMDEGEATPSIASSMPLMSFPWLFPKELGKIANGDLISSMRYEPIPAKRSSSTRQNMFSTEVDDLETAEGIKHRGDLLELKFGHGHGDVALTNEKQVKPPLVPVASQPRCQGISDTSEESDESEYLSADEHGPIALAYHSKVTSVDSKESWTAKSVSPVFTIKGVTRASSSYSESEVSTEQVQEKEVRVVEETEDEEEDIEFEIDARPSALDRLEGIIGSDEE